jgi:hypothetical protein
MVTGRGLEYIKGPLTVQRRGSEGPERCFLAEEQPRVSIGSNPLGPGQTTRCPST